MTAAHGGYGSERVPLGGGAAVFERLAAAWAGHDLTLLGPGPDPPDGVRYLRLDLLGGRPPSTLSELAYARFCRDFEAACTEALLREARGGVVVAHDLSEGPTFSALARHGIPCVPVLHVDVADFFCRLYLRGRVAPERAEALARRARPWPFVPDLLRLVFDKQADAAACCPRLVVPSAGMATTLQRIYPDLGSDRLAVIPWGAPEAEPPRPQVEAEKARLQAEWALPPGGPVLVTLSRLSPEKGQDVLLEALGAAERRGEVPPGLTVVICGEAAFMQGVPFQARLKDLASRLRDVRVLFPGHLGGATKRAALELGTVFVSASRHESYGLTTMEAMAAGLPVVAVDTPGSRETVDGTCGLLVEAGDLWPAVRRVLADPAALAGGARRRAASHGFGRAADRLLEVLAEASGGMTVA